MDADTRWWNKQVGAINLVGVVMKVMTANHGVVLKGEYGICTRLNANDQIEVNIFGRGPYIFPADSVRAATRRPVGVTLPRRP